MNFRNVEKVLDDQVAKHDIDSFFQTMLENILKDQPTDPKTQLVGQLSGTHRLGEDSPLTLSEMQSMLEAVRKIEQEQAPWEVSRTACDEACRALNCQRAAVFVHSGDELVTLVAKGSGKGAKKMAQPAGTGFMGQAHTLGQLINVEDAQKDSRFNPQSDQITGMRTKSILVIPVQDKNGDQVAVIQFTNKNDTPSLFTKKDETVGSLFCSFLGGAIAKSIEWELNSLQSQRTDVLLKVSRSLGKDQQASAFSSHVLSQAQTLVSSERASFHFCDWGKNQLVVVAERGETRGAMNAGLPGACVQSGQPVNVKDVQKDQRFDSEADKKAMLNTRCMLCVPLRDATGAIIGVVSACNKKTALLWSGSSVDVFEEKEVDMLAMFAGMVGPKMGELFKSTINLAKKKE